MPKYNGDEEDRESAAARRIQKTVRGIASRSHYKITKLNVEDASDYIPFFLGNDTPLTDRQLAEHTINTNFVLVGTALFRSIDIACKLAATSDVFPKVIIVDNSRRTHLAWKQIQAFFAASPPDETWRIFLHKSDGFLEFILDTLMDNVRFDGGVEPPTYFRQFSKLYSLEYVKRVVAGVVTIQQDWGDLETFQKIARIYADRPIVAYPSNIIDFVSHPTQIQVLRCIDCLKPCLSLCTNLDSVRRMPTKCYVFTDCQPSFMAEVMELSEETKAMVTLMGATPVADISAIEPAAATSTGAEAEEADLEASAKTKAECRTDNLRP
ncbi:hypothetical protein [Legionella nagasakiensis]|uniref:hypothetical protein n=1 Tax=Legionella nagasakiensis TaxID=535290 RepID=UPI00105460FF|nr:hypothetical protein [Legionella nagasakiensis]